MAFSHVLLLSCVAYVAVAHPPVSSNLSPGGTVSRQSSKGPATAPVVNKVAATGPSSSYLPPLREVGTIGTVNSAKPAGGKAAVSGLTSSNVPPSKRVTGARLTAPTAGLVVPRSTVQKPIYAAAGPKTISASVGGAARPIKSGRPAAPASVPGVSRPTVQKTIATGGAPRSAPITSGHKQSGKKVGNPVAHTVRAHAPY